MPRGNDPDAAKEFEEEYGVPGNAETLIKAQQDSYSRELRAASLGRLDPVATNALDLDAVESALEGDDSVVSASVRGGYVIAVVEEEDGRVHKEVLKREDAGLSDDDLEKSREALNLPKVVVGEAAYREGASAAVEAAAEQDAEERERREAREAKAEAAAAEAAPKSKSKSSKKKDE